MTETFSKIIDCFKPSLKKVRWKLNEPWKEETNREVKNDE